ncbi:MAG: nuclear transport factor 2 family protein [Caulobacteraceae bacterium]|nr:nuclear transport factor 2 family protein [Caulobacteraceae bacterium]
MTRLILAAFLGLIPAPVAAQDATLSPSAVQSADPAAASAVAVVEGFHAALKSGDGDAALAFLADDVVVLEGGGAERSRDEYAHHHLPADMTFAAATTAEVTRRAAWVEGDLAWVLTEGRTTGEFNGRAVNSVSAETMILQRGPHGWRIRHVHWSSRTPR